MSDMTITEVSHKYHLNAATLRYYERIGLRPKVPRRANGNRYYDDHLQARLEMINSGVPVEELVKYAQLLEQGDSTLDAREQLLKEQLAMLIQKRKNLDRSIERLQHKISLYESGEIRQNRSYFDEYDILDD